MPVFEPLVVSAGLVGLAEVGDKSMLMGVLLTLRYQRPWLVFWGLVVGMTANLGIAATAGVLLGSWLDGDWVSWVLGFAFLGMAVWALLSGDKTQGDEEEPPQRSRRSVFVTAALGYFLLEMADKTQVATLALAASYEMILPVLAGAVLGVVAVNAPAIWLGQQFAGRLPVRALRMGAAGLFALLGIWVLLENVLAA
ncbi:MAG: TMEM165/GDT1 family protein [Pseudohongiellaceae bacterium]